MLAPKINPKLYSNVCLIRVSGKLAVQYLAAHTVISTGRLRSLLADQTNAGTTLGVCGVEIRRPHVVVLFDDDNKAMEYYLSI